jgi:hypothetical protein
MRRKGGLLETPKPFGVAFSFLLFFLSVLIFACDICRDQSSILGSYWDTYDLVRI